MGRIKFCYKMRTRNSGRLMGHHAFRLLFLAQQFIPCLTWLPYYHCHVHGGNTAPSPTRTEAPG
jgi:hypothetical protein